MFSTHWGEYVENELYPGQNFVQLKIVMGRVVSYAPLVSTVSELFAETFHASL